MQGDFESSLDAALQTLKATLLASHQQSQAAGPQPTQQSQAAGPPQSQAASPSTGPLKGKSLLWKKSINQVILRQKVASAFDSSHSCLKNTAEQGVKNKTAKKAVNFGRRSSDTDDAQASAKGPQKSEPLPPSRHDEMQPPPVEISPTPPGEVVLDAVVPVQAPRPRGSVQLVHSPEAPDIESMNGADEDADADGQHPRSRAQRKGAVRVAAFFEAADDLDDLDEKSHQKDICADKEVGVTKDRKPDNARTKGSVVTNRSSVLSVHSVTKRGSVRSLASQSLNFIVGKLSGQMTTAKTKTTDPVSDCSSPKDDEEEDSQEDIEEDSEEDSEEEMQHTYFLSENWNDYESKKLLSKSRTKQSSFAKNLDEAGANEGTCPQDVEDVLVDLVDNSSCLGRLLGRCMLHPRSRKKLLWNWYFLFCVLHDALVMPLVPIGLPNSWLLELLDWTVRVCLNLDLFVSFITGIANQSYAVDMRPRMVGRRYLRTWFMFDFTVAMTDWAQLALAFNASHSLALTILWVNLRVAKGTKLFGSSRLPELFQSMVYLGSDLRSVYVGLAKLILALLWLTHCVASFWFAIGLQDHGSNSWMSSYGYDRDSFIEKYAASYHWSFSHFTGSIDIMPQNVVERLFALLALVVAFVASSLIVSRMTTIMTQFQITRAERSKAFGELSTYLHQNKISKSLSLRIQTTASQVLLDDAKQRREDQVELLQLISEPLRIQLRYEANSGVLKGHAFFLFYDAVYPQAMQEICHEGFTRHRLAKGDVLFSYGQIVDEQQMFFLTAGRVSYSHHDLNTLHLDSGHWFSEAALWTYWCYHGTLRVQSDCSIAMLDAATFQKIACKSLRKDANPIKYGRMLLKTVNQFSPDEQTDLSFCADGEWFDVWEEAEKVFGSDPRAAGVVAQGRRKPSRRASALIQGGFF